MPVLSQAVCGSYSGSDSSGDSEREHAAVSDEHQLQWTPHTLCTTLSREFHALTGSMRLLFRIRERENAAVICLKRLRKVTSRS
jgi:hypothetical protein